MAYQQLDSGKIVETAETLHRRVRERFPEAGLTKVCGELAEIAKSAAERSVWIARPILWVRCLSVLLIAAIFATAAWTGWALYQAGRVGGRVSLAEWIQATDSVLNDLVLIGATVFFVITLEARIKRRRALRAIHELRSLAHIIDMHQLTKDPERLLRQWTDTQSSPRRTMSRFELSRYLDYCAEMLSVTGKIAALYVQRFEDSVAVSAVNDIEELTTAMSGKIWQKVMVLHAGDKEQALASGNSAPAEHAAPAKREDAPAAGAVAPPA